MSYFRTKEPIQKPIGTRTLRPSTMFIFRCANGVNMGNSASQTLTGCEFKAFTIPRRIQDLLI